MNTEITEDELDIEYCNSKAFEAMCNGDEDGVIRWNTKANLLRDAVIVYRIKGRVDSDVLKLMRFGFTIEEAMGMLARRDKYHDIPASLLVQTFMRKLQDASSL